MRRSLWALMLAVALLAGCLGQPPAQAPSAQATAIEPAPTPPYTPLPSAPYTPAPMFLATSRPAATTRESTGLERKTLSGFNAAVLAWNKAATPVAADINDPTLDVEHFGERTAKDRAKMTTSLAAMRAAIAVGADGALVAAVREMIGSYEWKMSAIDGVIAAVQLSDQGAMEAALSLWGIADGKRYQAAPALLEAARPYLMPAEIAEWERAFAGT